MEVENADNETEFEGAIDDLAKQLHGGSWYEGEDGNPLWEYLERADKLSGVGHYGVIFLGLDDVKSISDLAEPIDLPTEVEKVKPTPRKLLFMRVLDESMAQIADWEDDQQSANYGKPKFYNLQLANEQVGTLLHPISQNTTETRVHWSRVVHIADGLYSSEIVGIPRQRPVVNRLLDLYKMYGGSAEMYWRGAFPGLAVETQPQLVGKTKLDVGKVRDQLENYQNSLQRYLALMGVNVKTLAPQVVEPTAQIQVLIEAICIKMAVPMRVFMGSERGELASSQDAKSWDNRLKKRRNKYLTPRVVVPFIDRLIRLGVLPIPKQYIVTWQEEETMTRSEKADVAVKRTQALAAYIQGGVENLIAPQDYLTRELDYTDEEAEAMLESSVEHMEEVEEEEAVKQQEFMDQGRDPMTGQPIPPEPQQPPFGKKEEKKNGKPKPFE